MNNMDSKLKDQKDMLKKKIRKYQLVKGLCFASSFIITLVAGQFIANELIYVAGVSCSAIIFVMTLLDMPNAVWGPYIGYKSNLEQINNELNDYQFNKTKTYDDSEAVNQVSLAEPLDEPMVEQTRIDDGPVVFTKK